MTTEQHGRNLTTPEVLEAAEKQWRALELRKTGLGYRQIAKRMECCLGAAYGYVASALAEQREKIAESAIELREIEVGKLDKLERKIWAAIKESTSEQDKAKLASVIVKITESRRKLLGLDAPQKIEHTGNLYTVATASPDCPEWEGKPAAEPKTSDEPEGESNV